MAERVVASGWLSQETRYCLVIDGQYDTPAVCRLIDLLTLQKAWLDEAVAGDLEIASWGGNA